MNSASISADIISFTSLSIEDRRKIENEIQDILKVLTKKYKAQNFFGRIIRGDYIECALESSTYSLRIALILKTFIKSIELNYSTKEKGVKYFKEHGIRLALAIAPLNTIDRKEGIIDGEAIFMSGRAIKDFSTSNKKKIVIKNTMFFLNANEQVQEQYEAIIHLLDILISRCSPKQCEIIYLRLLGYSETELIRKLKKSQSTISQHTTSSGWHAIDKTVTYFEKNIA